MKKLRHIKYPINRAEAIKYIRSLNIRWASIIAIPDRRARCRKILKIVKEAEDVVDLLNDLKGEEVDSELENAYILLDKWLKLRWRSRK